MRLSPYLAFAKKSFLNRSAYRFDHFIGILDTLLKIFIFWEIYQTLYGTRVEVDGITLKMVATSFVLSICLEAIFFVDDNYLPDKIRDGSIANELLRPVSVQGRMLAENLGTALFRLGFHFCPAFVISIFFIGIEMPASLPMLFLFMLSSVLGYGVLWSISFLVQMTSFWLMNIWSLITIKNVFVNVLSGAMIPLWFMPDWMKKIIDFTPFSSIYFAPVQIYLGQLSYDEIACRCVLQLLWIGIIYSLGYSLWIRGQRKLVVQGG
ncbi:MAG: ABC-2 family transporter protein [Lachnospiraceae bacterium]|nr:ABC-2 family transporter protein [Lachnospiraceae bacterium]